MPHFGLFDNQSRAVNKALKALRKEIKSDVFTERNINALGELKDARAVEPLIECLKDDRDRVRWAAAHALGEIGDRRAIEPLILAFKEDHSISARSLSTDFGLQVIAPLLTALQNKQISVSRALEVLTRLGAPAKDPLVSALDSESAPVREAAARALTEIGGGPQEKFLAMLADPAWKVRQAAADALQKMGDERAVEPLIAALGDENKMVRRAVVGALGAIGDPRAEEPLIAALKDENELVRRAVTKALGKVKGADTVEPLIAALGDLGSEQVRRKAAESLGKIKDPGAVEPLIAVLKDETPSVRQAAVDALRKIGDPCAVVPLLELLGDEQHKIRKSVVQALDKLGWEPDQGKAGAWYWMVKAEWEKCAASGAAAIEPLLAALEVEPEPIKWNNLNIRMKIANGKIDPEKYRRGAARKLQEFYGSGELEPKELKAIEAKLHKINEIIEKDFTDKEFGKGYYY